MQLEVPAVMVEPAEAETVRAAMVETAARLLTPGPAQQLAVMAVMAATPPRTLMAVMAVLAAMDPPR
jgi:hypothetical protein